MTALLYVSYSSGLNESEILDIDLTIFKNNQDIKKFLKKVSKKVKVIIISTGLGVVIFFSGMKNAKNTDTIGLTPRPQLVSTVYNPHVSIFDDYRPRPFGLDMDKTKQIVSQHDFSYHSQSAPAIKELRAGGSRVTQATWLFITIWMLSRQQGVSFQAATSGISKEFTLWKAKARSIVLSTNVDVWSTTAIRKVTTLF